MSPLNKNIYLLTGATGGIGQALAHELAARGVQLILTSRSQTGLENLHSQLPSESVLLVHAADLTKDAERTKLVNAVKHLPVSTLINLSGTNDVQLFEFQLEAQLNRLITLNLIAPISLTRQMLPILKRANNPTIVNVGSTFGSIGFPGYVTYCASKFGLRGFTEALRRELSGQVEVLFVAPRATQTSMNEGFGDALNSALKNAIDTPAEVARSIIRALHQNRKNTFIGWPEKFFARLNQLFPSMVDRAINNQLPTINEVLAPPLESTKPTANL
ncbi:MAG: SDR family oxidoreductase [Gammaproteobacteria bacterium]|nr:SDR family oxidoreductase [Gammaproteobacteria bacterium]